MFVLSLLSLLPSPTQRLHGACSPHSVSSALSLYQQEPAGLWHRPCSAQESGAEHSQGHGSAMLFLPGNRRKTCPSVTNQKLSHVTQQPWVQKGNPDARSELRTLELQLVLFCKIPLLWNQPYPYHCDS